MVDATVMVHRYCRSPAAMSWLNTQHRYGVTSITWLEMMQGVSNKLSHHIGKEDCLIGSLAVKPYT